MGIHPIDLHFGRYDDLNNAHLTTRYVLDIFQEGAKVREVSIGRGEDVQASVHVKSTSQ